jgi:hypothetical protein
VQHDLAFLHTSDVHVQTFAQLATEVDPAVRVRHVVVPELLAQARSAGLTPALVARVHRAMTRAASSGARTVVCTCSSIGGAAESAGGTFRAMRIDRAMADQAVKRGRRILVVAALQSTLRPTRELLEDSARRAGTRIEPEELLAPGAWALFERGDANGYAAAVAAAIRAGAASFDVVVLAQASMAAAAEQCADLGVPILSSPRLGVQAALAR